MYFFVFLKPRVELYSGPTTESSCDLGQLFGNVDCIPSEHNLQGQFTKHLLNALASHAKHAKCYRYTI